MSQTQLRRTSAALACVLACVVMTVHANAQAEPRAPQLSISVDNGKTSTKVGDTLKYAIVVKNLGARRVRSLKVTQTMPRGLNFVSADKSGKAMRHAVVWTVDVAPTSTTTLHTTTDVGRTPDELLRLATVACAALSSKKPPVVCATHSDELPAGAAATAALSRPAVDDEGSAQLSTAEYAGLGGLLLFLAALGALVVRRKRAPTPSV